MKHTIDAAAARIHSPQDDTRLIRGLGPVQFIGSAALLSCPDLVSANSAGNTVSLLLQQ